MVIILSRDSILYSTQSLESAFLEAGHRVQVIDVLALEIKVGYGVFLNGELLQPTLVIPRFSSHLLVAGLAVLREWENRSIPVLNSSQSIAIANDQLATLQHLQQAGLPIPQTSFCSQPSTEETFDSILGEGEAKVIKLLDSSQGRGVTLAQDSTTARSLLTTLASLRSSGLTQKYYGESEGCDYRLIVLHGEVVAAISRRSKEGEFRANLHQGATAEPYEPSERQKELAIKAAEALGLDFAGVDLLPTAKGDLVLEVNASPGLQGAEGGEHGFISRLISKSL